MNARRLPALDWMKALGMALIVLGHVGAAATRRFTPPFYPKQLGVAFFLFAAGFTLARERRPATLVLFRRLFEVLLVGVGCALTMSVITYLRMRDLAESNYLPFLAGVNVAVDAFPANPTTWFIGTYIHALVLWALALRRLRIRPWMILAAGLVEVAIRGLLIGAGTLYVAYMILPNWATVFLLGLYRGQRAEDGDHRPGLTPALLALGVLAIAWPLVAWSWLNPSPSFPFMMLRLGPRPVMIGLTSVVVTILYVGYTGSVDAILRRAPAAGWVRFLARNTPFVFVVHMPMYFGLSGPGLARLPYPLRVATLFLICYVGLALISEFLRSLLPLERWRHRLGAVVERTLSGGACGRTGTEITATPSSSESCIPTSGTVAAGSAMDR